MVLLAIPWEVVPIHFGIDPVTTEAKAEIVPRFGIITRWPLDEMRVIEDYITGLMEIIELAYQMNGSGKRKRAKEEIIRELNSH